MTTPFSNILADSDYSEFEIENGQVNYWFYMGIIRKFMLNLQIGSVLVQIVETFDEKGCHHSYGNKFSYQKLVNGFTVDWKYSTHGKTHSKTGYTQCVTSSNNVMEISCIDGLNTFINDSPSTIHSFPDGITKHWERNGVYFERPNNQPNILAYHGSEIVVCAWKNEKGDLHNLTGPAIIVKHGTSISEYFFVNGIQVHELPNIKKANDENIKLKRLKVISESIEFDELMREADAIRIC